MQSLSSESASRIQELDARCLSNIAWGFAWSQLIHDPLLDVISLEATRRYRIGDDVYTHGTLWSIWRSNCQDLRQVRQQFLSDAA